MWLVLHSYADQYINNGNFKFEKFLHYRHSLHNGYILRDDRRSRALSASKRMCTRAIRRRSFVFIDYTIRHMEILYNIMEFCLVLCVAVIIL